MTTITKTQIRASWDSKTSKEREESLDKLYAEIVQKGVKAIDRAFAKARQDALEHQMSQNAIS